MERTLKVALVHDWLTTYRGGEKVLEHLAALYPTAPIYTLFYDPTHLPTSLQNRTIIFPKGLNRCRNFRKEFLLPLYPFFMESFDLTDYDLIISSSSCVAKGVIPGPNARHLCYLHAPMRYIWDQQKSYFHRYDKIPILSFVTKILSTALRIWDVTSATRVDQFIANSHFGGQRIQRYYNRDFVVIHPPVEIPSAPPSWRKKDYYLMAGAFVPYKRIDLAIAACKHLKKKLVIAGSGGQEPRLRALAKGADVEFILAPSEATLKQVLGEAKGLLFPGVEDFGILPVEAIGQGTPLIAFQAGGALDYLIPGENGVFFSPQTEQGLIEGIQQFEAQPFDPVKVYETAKKFTASHFQHRIQAEISKLLPGIHPL